MRRILFIAGILVLAALWLGPLPVRAEGSFAAHMAMHMGVVAVAAPMLALGAAGTRLDPALRWPRAVTPIPASVLELIVVWAWHAPLLHHLARHHPAGLVLEQGSFLLAGLLVWASAFGGAPAPGRRAAGVVGLLLTSMHMTLLGALLALSPRPLYEHLAGAGSLTALDDQHLGGAIMLLVGAAAYLAGGVALTARVLRRRLHLADDGL